MMLNKIDDNTYIVERDTSSKRYYVAKANGFWNINEAETKGGKLNVQHLTEFVTKAAAIDYAFGKLNS